MPPHLAAWVAPMVALASAINYFFITASLPDRNGGLILRTEVDVTDAMRPDRLEVSLEVSNTFERYIRELRADRD